MGAAGRLAGISIAALLTSRKFIQAMVGLVIFSAGLIFSWTDNTWRSAVIGFPLIVAGFVLILLSA
jgi:hypothetical protein